MRRSIRSFGLLAFANGASQLISLIFIIIIAAIYTPADIGVFQLYFSIAMILILISSLRLDLSIISSESDGCCEDNYTAGRLVIIGIFFVLILVLCAWQLILPDANVEFRRILFFSSLACLSGGLVQLYTAVAVRHGQFSAIAYSKLVQVLAFGPITITLALVEKNALFILASDAFSRTLAVVPLLLRAPKGIREVPILTPFSRFIATIERNRKYILFTSPGSLASGLSINLVPLLVFGYYGATAAGIYAIAERILLFPITLVANAANQVFSKIYTDNLRRDHPKANRVLLVRLISLGVLFGAPVTVAVYVFAPTLASMFAPQEWAAIGLMSAAISPQILVRATTTPIGTALVLSGAQIQQFAYDTGRVALVFLTMFMLFQMSFQLVDSLLIMSCALVFAGAVFCYITIRRTMKSIIYKEIHDLAK